MFFLFPYLTRKLFCFLCIRLLVCHRAFFTDLLVEFSFVIFEGFFFFGVSITWLFRGNFWVSLPLPISFDLCLQIVGCFGFLYFYPNISCHVLSFLNTFAYGSSFFTYLSIVISHLGFVFLNRFPKGTLIFITDSFIIGSFSSRIN